MLPIKVHKHSKSSLMSASESTLYTSQNPVVNQACPHISDKVKLTSVFNALVVKRWGSFLSRFTKKEQLFIWG